MSQFVDLPLKDRMKTVFLNENMADAHFLVGLEGLTKERIPGHSLLLATASEVFHGQLYGHFEVPETIVVDDTTAETFKTMLSYIYTEAVDLTLDNAFPVLYLAKKYLLNNLLEKVSLFIATAYTGQNVAKVLKHMPLLDGEQADTIWQLVELQAVAVLHSKEFLEISREDLCVFLRRDLNADEVTIFNSTLAWAQAECARKNLPYAENARTVLGDAIALIRFPLMTIEQFTDGPVQSGLLTDQEILAVYKWYGSKVVSELMIFPTSPRKRPLLTCNRIDPAKVGWHSRGWSNHQKYTWFFEFSVTARIFVQGVGFIGRRNESCNYQVDLSLLNLGSGETLAAVQANVTTDANDDIYKVLFDTPALISPGAHYKINASSIGPNSWYARNGQDQVVCQEGEKSVTFMFAADTGLRGPGPYDVVKDGIIPEIYFSFA